MFSPRLSRFLPRLTVLLPALPDVHLSVHREVHAKPLRDFSLGSVVTSDYVTPLTGDEPKQDLNLTDAEELNLTTSSDIYFQNALGDISSFPNDPDVDDNELAEFLAVVVDRTGKPDKRSDKKLGRNSLKRQLSDARQLGFVFQDMTPPKSILRKSTDMPKTIQRVKFKKAIARHTKIRDQNPSLGYICPGEPHERSPNAPKFEDRSQEETEWQELGAREAAWKLAKSVFKLKEHEKAAFFSPPENRGLPASTLKPEERVCCGLRCVNAHDQQKGP